MTNKTSFFSAFYRATMALFLFGISAIFMTPQLHAEKPYTRVAEELIGRVLPAHADAFVCETGAADEGMDVFEIEARDGKIVLRGNSSLSIAVGFNWYLRYVALASYDWQAAEPLKISGDLPLPKKKIRKTCLAKERFMFNYCTFGYSLPFKRWDNWERLIDWLAMNGINLPLLQAGQEAVWLRVWKSYGLSDLDVRSFFSGPAHLPWHRMVNLDKWGGPLPISYIEGQRKLQQKIVKRARALGMKTLLPAFAGHVPEALKKVKPKAKIQAIDPGWAGMPNKYGTFFLDPSDPLFTDIQIRYLKQQEELYGTDHTYSADPFNEIKPPSWEPEYMANVAKSIYAGMEKADPEAVWYQMSWTFFFIKGWLNKHKSGETPFSAMAKALPKGKMVFLDYHGEYRELYPKTNRFEGAPFIWNYLANFGGCTYLLAPMDRISKRIHKAFEIENCVGVGSTLEGISVNPMGYELTFEQPWHKHARVDYIKWMEDYAVRRVGSKDPAVVKGWKILTEKSLTKRNFHDADHGSCLSRLPYFNQKSESKNKEYSANPIVPARDPVMIQGYVEALDEMFKAGPGAKNSDVYKFDVVNLLRQAMAYHSDNLRVVMMDYYKRKNLVGFRKASHDMLELIKDVDTLLGTRHEFLLGAWIKDAVSWADNAEEAAYYEHNARQILTTWYYEGNKLWLIDYAFREWNGLLGTYALPRWEKFVKGLDESLAKKSDYDYASYVKWRKTFENEWTKQTGVNLLTEPVGDPVETARSMFKKYRESLMNTGKKEEVSQN